MENEDPKPLCCVPTVLDVLLNSRVAPRVAPARVSPLVSPPRVSPPRVSPARMSLARVSPPRVSPARMSLACVSPRISPALLILRYMLALSEKISLKIAINFVLSIGCFGAALSLGPP
jgi:hypothetical protein